MINKNQLFKGINTFVAEYTDKIAVDNPLMCFIKPILTRVVNNKLTEYEHMVSLVADKEGNIDVSNILTEMSQNLINTTPFIVEIPSIGPLYIGNGSIKIDIPYTNKNLMLDQNDLNNLKEILTNKN